jgi:hypothetical protein
MRVPWSTVSTVRVPGRQLLEKVNLGYILSRFNPDSVENWAQARPARPFFVPLQPFVLDGAHASQICAGSGAYPTHTCTRNRARRGHIS